MNQTMGEVYEEAVRRANAAARRVIVCKCVWDLDIGSQDGCAFYLMSGDLPAQRVSSMTLASDEIRDAFAWLEKHGQAELCTGAGGNELVRLKFTDEDAAR